MTVDSGPWTIYRVVRCIASIRNEPFRKEGSAITGKGFIDILEKELKE